MKYIYIYIFLPSEKIFVCLFVPTQRCKYRSVNHSQGAIFPNFSGKIRLVDYRRGEAWRRPVIVSTASNPRSSRPLSLSVSLSVTTAAPWILFSFRCRSVNRTLAEASPRTRRSRPRLLLFLSRFLARGCLAIEREEIAVNEWEGNGVS